MPTCPKWITNLYGTIEGIVSSLIYAVVCGIAVPFIAIALILYVIFMGLVLSVALMVAFVFSILFLLKEARLESALHTHGEKADLSKDDLSDIRSGDAKKSDLLVAKVQTVGEAHKELRDGETRSDNTVGCEGTDKASGSGGESPSVKYGWVSQAVKQQQGQMWDRHCRDG